MGLDSLIQPPFPFPVSPKENGKTGNQTGHPALPERDETGKNGKTTPHPWNRPHEPHTLEPEPMPTATSLQPPRVPVADLRARLKILYAGPECWSVRWDEPLAPADPRQWTDYLNHAEAVLIPLLRQHSPA
jgi:hypothetical protein